MLTKQNKLHEFLNSLQKTTKEAFRPEAQQFIGKAIYAKMRDHVKTKLNRAYLEDKLCLVMRPSGLGAADEPTLVPLNSVETVPLE